MTKKFIRTTNVNIGDKIRIVHLQGEGPEYDGREGIVQYIDDTGMLHGSWGGLAVIPETDNFLVLQTNS